VFLLGVFELWAAVPAGLVLDMSPLAIILASSLGAITAAFVVIVIGENIRNWLLKKYDYNSPGLRGKFLRNLWEKYGVIGLGIFSPLLFGAPLGAAIGVALGAPRKRLLMWMSLGIVIWSIGLTLAGLQGIIVFQTMS
jgi:hypothetical protein